MMNAESRLVYKLIEKGYTISCAESCTGGLVASRIVNVPDASRVLNVSFVTYANEAKHRFLGGRQGRCRDFRRGRPLRRFS